MKHKFQIPALLLTLALALTQTAAVSADENNISSIIVNDDEWYRDGEFPLTVRDGKYYVPAEAFTMFEYIRVTQPKKGNLLITNTTDGRYISILYMEQKAAVNGVIYSGIGVFRRSEKYYVDAEMTASALGISLEARTGGKSENSESGSGLTEGMTVLRLYDDSHIFTLDELIETYAMYDEDFDAAQTQPDQALYYEDGYNYHYDYDSDDRRIFVLCTTPAGDEGQFSAASALDDERLDYTAALDEDSAQDRDYVMSNLVKGEVLIIPKGYAESRNNAVFSYMDEDELESAGEALADKMDEINRSQKSFTQKNVRFTLSSNNAKIDGILKSRGYIPLTPDYEINGASYPEGVTYDIEKRLESGGSVIMYLTDCWSSVHMTELLWDMSVRGYDVINLDGE